MIRTVMWFAASSGLGRRDMAACGFAGIDPGPIIVTDSVFVSNFRLSNYRSTKHETPSNRKRQISLDLFCKRVARCPFEETTADVVL